MTEAGAGYEILPLDTIPERKEDFSLYLMFIHLEVCTTVRPCLVPFGHA
jgi:hypothetical protein